MQALECQVSPGSWCWVCWQLGGHVARHGTRGAASVDVGHDSIGHTLAVCMPGQAILLQTLLLIPGLTVYQQRSEVKEVEVGQQVGHPCGERGLS